MAYRRQTCPADLLLVTGPVAKNMAVAPQRAYDAKPARHLGVCGWVRNRSDGSVKALAIIAWARHGPPSARVSHVSVELAQESCENFTERPSL